MRRTWLLAALFLCLSLPLWIWPNHSHAQNNQTFLFRPFEARLFDPEELRLLQWALSLEGDYIGLIDGAWGARSQTALAAFSSRRYSDSPRIAHVPALAMRLIDQISDEGWGFSAFPGYGGSILFPDKATVETPQSGSFRNWAHTTSSLNYSFALTNADKMVGFHSYVSSQSPLAEPLYTVRRKDRIVTSAVLRSGMRIYVRSDLINGFWRTVLLSAKAQDKNWLSAVAASIAPTPPRPITLPENGMLYRALDALLAEIDDAPPATAQQTPPPEKRSAPDQLTSSGTGFLVTAAGVGLTNDHVVAQCSSLRVNSAAATVIDQSQTFDLAIIQLANTRGLEPAVFSATPLELNADVTAAGFPFSGILEGLNVTRGAVSSLKGLAGDDIRLQISAPVQPGNSGGPLLDASGHIAGVVAAKLSRSATESRTGAVPENINFAIAGEIAKLFLTRNGIAFSSAGPSTPLSGAEIGRKAQSITFLIECLG